MYCPKQRAWSPFVTATLATLHVGIGVVARLRPELFASALIAVGVMSGVPVICWNLSSLAMVFLPLLASTRAAAPKAMSTTPATTPPISRIRFMVIPSFDFGVWCDIALHFRRTPRLRQE